MRNTKIDYNSIFYVYYYISIYTNRLHITDPIPINGEKPMQQNMKILIIALSLLALSIPVQAADVTYEIRSTIYDVNGPVDVGSHYWDANTFPGFWYQIGGSRSSEVIYIHNTWNPENKMKIGDTIPEGQMYYASKPVIKRTKIGGLDGAKDFIVDGVDLENYYLAGLFGVQHMAMSSDSKNSSSGYNPEELAKIIIESDDKKTMTTGEEWKLPGGWSLVVQQIDIKGNKVWLELKKDGEVLDSEVLSTDPELPKQKRTYLYKDNNNNPVFYC